MRPELLLFLVLSAPVKVVNIRELPIDATNANRIHRLSTAPGVATRVEFQVPFAATPTCGDCCSDEKCGPSNPALFRILVLNDQKAFEIKTRFFPGRQDNGTVLRAEDFLTTVNVPLEHGPTVTFQVELAALRKADARVIVTLPNQRAELRYIHEQVARERTAIEQAFASKVEAEVTDGLLRAFAGARECVTKSPRVWHQQMILQLQEVCRQGGRLLVRASLENRGRAQFEVGDVELRRRGEASPLVGRQLITPSTTLGFEDASVIVIAVPSDPAVKRYDLRVSERGGQVRELVLKDFGF
jgi:hypothetical protein